MVGEDAEGGERDSDWSDEGIKVLPAFLSLCSGDGWRRQAVVCVLLA